MRCFARLRFHLSPVQDEMTFALANQCPTPQVIRTKQKCLDELLQTASRDWTATRDVNVRYLDLVIQKIAIEGSVLRDETLYGELVQGARAGQGAELHEVAGFVGNAQESRA